MNNERSTTRTVTAPATEVENTRGFNSTNIIAIAVTEADEDVSQISNIETITNLLSNVSNLKEVS